MNYAVHVAIGYAGRVDGLAHFLNVVAGNVITRLRSVELPFRFRMADAGNSGAARSMSVVQSFSVVVLKGANRGRILRTDRKRISVGRSPENDLVLDGAGISDRHFLVLVDHERWRIHTLSPDDEMIVDRGWVDPRSGTRGAIAYLGDFELLLFPGELHPEVVHEELARRSPHADEVATSPQSHPDSASELTPVVSELPVARAGDLAKFAQLPTILGGEIPKDLQAMAQVIGQGQHRAASEFERSKEITENDWKPPSAHAGPNGLDPGPQGFDASTATFVPEVVVEPESQLVPSTEPSKNRRGRDGTNVWGDSPPGRSKSQNEASPEPGEEPSKKNRTHSSDRDSSSRPANTSVLGPRTQAALVHAGFVISIEDLVQRASDPALQILREPDGELANSIRLLSTRIEDLVRSLGYRAYAFTSPEPLTGKTTTLLNLAFALSEDTRKRVALVEANFRNPRIAEIFGIAETHGLISVLESKFQLAESIVKISDRNLVILPSGGRHARPAELLASPRFKTLITELIDTVDIALIDAPSVKPSADVNLILPLVDGAFMVVLDRSTRMSALDEAVTQLGPTRVLGAVYNRIARERRKAIERERDHRMNSSAH